jgi:hypothetical protein
MSTVVNVFEHVSCPLSMPTFTDAGKQLSTRTSPENKTTSAPAGTEHKSWQEVTPSSTRHPATITFSHTLKINGHSHNNADNPSMAIFSITDGNTTEKLRTWPACVHSLLLSTRMSVLARLDSQRSASNFPTGVHSQPNQNKGNFPDPQGQVHTGSFFDVTVSRPRQLLSHAAS